MGPGGSTSRLQLAPVLGAWQAMIKVEGHKEDLSVDCEMISWSTLYARGKGESRVCVTADTPIDQEDRV